VIGLIQSTTQEWMISIWWRSSMNRVCNTFGVTVAAIVSLHLLLQYKPNLRKVACSIIEVESFEVNWKV
jgi:hypothetical protein